MAYITNMRTILGIVWLILIFKRHAVQADGTWSIWSAWNGCSSTCGRGMNYRTRACVGGNSSACSGDGVDFQPCDLAACPMDSGWSVWSSWGACTSTCDIGVKMRFRVCATNKSIKNCPGDYRQAVACNQQPCTVTGNQTLCATGWINFNGACYQFTRRTVSWQEAKSICASAGSYLLEINSNEEMNFVHSHAQAWYWIGGTDAVQEGVWRWDHGGGVINDVTFSHWGSGEPNDNGGEDCVVLRTDGFWNDATCRETFNYACEKHV